MFKKYLSGFVEKIEKIESSVAGIRRDLNKFSEHNKNITQQHKEFEKRVRDIENKLTSEKNIAIDPNNIIKEINDRKRRESNVIALGIAESKKTVGNDRLEDDKISLSTALPAELSVKIPNFKIRRLGRPTTDRPRPLLIETRSVVDARDILKLNHREGSTVAFKPDLTPAQQSHLKNLRSQLDTLIKNGDTSKTIKYVQGVPQIVNKNFRPLSERENPQGPASLISKHTRPPN